MSEQTESEINNLVEKLVSEVTSNVNKNQFIPAFKSIAANAPFTTKDEKLKEKAFEAVSRAFSQTPATEIQKIINGLTSDECDTVMKYVYKAMERGEGCDNLLKWHDLLFQKFGDGILVRAINDRRTPVPSQEFIPKKEKK
eukprot:TRINITY_DN10386_c0_g1_i1.p1 TRINITY_DN10386_c0_g1~~TRINITY_DN10386_c0_g1_i1.p1  ORF type:complete len:141 (-),score=32.25 TRINITY_DN10386_c0_g1_i1:82-504(-)